MTLSKRLRGWGEDLLDHLRADNLWKRLSKYSLALTVAIILSVLPPVIDIYGVDTFFIPLQVVFAHPAQRVGSMIETQSLILSGVVIGTAWGSLGLYLSGLIVDTHVRAAYALRAVFVLIAVVLHGFLRSNTPKLFGLVFFMLMTSFIMLVSNYTHFTVSLLSTIMYPILTGHGIILLFGLGLFPESSSSFLGKATINTLSDTFETLSKASAWFIAPENELEPALTNTLTKKTTIDSVKTQVSLERKKTKTTELTRMRSILQNPVAHVRWRKPEKKKKKKKREEKSEEKQEEEKNEEGSEEVKEEEPVPEEEESALEALTKAKGDIRHSLSRCKTAQREVNFEISFSVLPLDVLRPITTDGMASLVQETIRVVGACENKLVMVEDNKDAANKDDSSLSEKSAPATTRHSEEKVEEPEPSSSSIFFKRPPLHARTLSTPKEEFLEKLKLVKPTREMEAGDADLLEAIVSRIREPTREFEAALQDAVAILIASLAYCYDVEMLPSGARAPKGLLLEEMDLFIDIFEEAISTFDEESMDEFKQLAESKGDSEAEEILPRFETFLVSSFLLGLRQAAIHILQMLRYTRLLVEARKRRMDRPRVYWPRFTDWAEWLSLGGEEDAMVLPKGARKSARSGANEAEPGRKSFDADEISIRTDRSMRAQLTRDTEAGRSVASASTTEPKKKKKKKKTVKFKVKDDAKRPEKDTWIMKIRGKAADAIEWVRQSDDLEYALKLSVAVALVSWPGFLPSWHSWYTSIRGVWAPLQLILVFEVAIGTSLFVFFMRLGGVVLGCTLGFAAYEIGSGNHAVAIIIMVLGFIPCVYVQLETKYVKVAIVCITTSTVVLCATFNKTKPAVVNFYSRLASFLIGGVVAILVEICLYPVRARDRLIESLSSALREIVRVQGAVSIGIDDPNLHRKPTRIDSVFASSRNKTEAALAAAETFLPFCVSEPRLKGNFKALVPVYAEIIFVLHQILDRMDNVVSLRKNYGFSVLEDINHLIYTYRRNVAGGVTLSIFAFLPSNRTAQLRLINRVREVVAARRQRDPSANLSRPVTPDSDASSVDTAGQIIARHRILSWNAETAGQMEIIEYVEELVELAKLLVGVNAFRGGMLEKPDFGAYMRSGKRFADPVLPRQGAQPERAAEAAGDTAAVASGFELRRAATYSGPVGRWAERKRRAFGRGQQGKEANDEEEEDVVVADAQVVPNSLRRVGTRLRRDATVTRRMSQLVQKGKAVERRI
ncbi:hypothetical protein jhhlp_003681 [Lomentospora prolificans]|uniref:Uncharacterized protein n=1 Tax=Lomentospora prolificans TaxID=41688 RepID=A0A2N3N9E6_9PEZI|nr:hypothetical protein jhhlp_003681 [Lomentospora prolificans]